MLKVSFAGKIVTSVPSYRAHLACYGPLSIVIIGSYLNINMTIQTCHQLYVQHLNTYVGHFSKHLTVCKIKFLSASGGAVPRLRIYFLVETPLEKS